MSTTNLPLTVPLANGRTGILSRSGRTIWLYDIENDTPTELATHRLPEDTDIVAFAPQSEIFQSGDGLLLVRSDGFLEVLSETLAAINFKDGEFPIPGARASAHGCRVRRRNQRRCGGA